MTLYTLTLRLRYYYRHLLNSFNLCPCGSTINRTSKGRPICPRCGK